MARKPKLPNQLSEDEIMAVIDRPIMLATFAKILGITPQALNASAVGFEVGWTFGECIRAINNYRRDRASGHTGELAEERAKLAAAQRERIEMDLAIKRCETAPIGVLSKALSDAVAVSVVTLEAVPGRVKMRDASLTACQILLLDDEIIKATNAISAAEIEVDDCNLTRQYF